MNDARNVYIDGSLQVNNYYRRHLSRVKCDTNNSLDDTLQYNSKAKLPYSNVLLLNTLPAMVHCAWHFPTQN